MVSGQLATMAPLGTYIVYVNNGDEKKIVLSGKILVLRGYQYTLFISRQSQVWFIIHGLTLYPNTLT